MQLFKCATGYKINVKIWYVKYVSHMKNDSKFGNKITDYKKLTNAYRLKYTDSQKIKL